MEGRKILACVLVGNERIFIDVVLVFSRNRRNWERPNRTLQNRIRQEIFLRVISRGHIRQEKSRLTTLEEALQTVA